MEKDTVAMYFVRAAVARLTAAASERVLELAGIPRGLLAETQARVPAGAFATLWMAVAKEIDDEFFGLDRRRAKVGTFAVVARASFRAETLGSALVTCLHAYSVIFDDLEGMLRVEGDEAIISITNRIEASDARRFAEETFLVMVYGLSCWLAQKRIPLSRAAFGFPRPEHADEYAKMFTSNLGFGARTTEIRFDARFLAAPVVRDEAQLKKFLRAAPAAVFLRYRDSGSYTARVRHRLRGVDFDAWPTLDVMASELHVAPSTLRRRLEAEATTYQAVKDDLRRDLAIVHLCAGDLTITGIARELGFHDASAFHRAFKKWTGTRPGSYRKKQGLEA